MIVLDFFVWFWFLILFKTNMGNDWAMLAILCNLLDYIQFDRQGICKDVSKDVVLFCRKKITAEVTNPPGLKLLLV